MTCRCRWIEKAYVSTPRGINVMASAQATWPKLASAVLPASSVRKCALYCVVALVAALYLFPFMRMLVGATDEGMYTYAAEEVVHGAIPGRDFVQENPPGAYYWLAIFFRLFGTSIVTARTVLLLTGVATALLVFYLARRIGSNGVFAAIFVLITSIPLTPINSPHYDSNLFALVALAVFLIGLDSMAELDFQRCAKIWPFATAGLLAGWVTCILQQKGFLFLLAFAITALLLHRRRALTPVAWMVAGYCLAGVVVILPYIAWGAFGDLIEANVKAPLFHYDSLNHVPYGYPLWTIWFPRLFGNLHANFSALFTLPTIFAMSLPFLFLVILPLLVPATALMARGSLLDKKLWPYWIAAYAMWLSEFHRQDLSHMRNGCLLLVILFFAACQRLGTRVSRYGSFALIAGTIALGMVTITGALDARERVLTRRGTLFAVRKDPVLAFLLTHTRPGDYVFVYPYAPVYYFLADLRNPTPVNVIVEQRDTPFIEKVVRDLDAKKPRYVVSETPLLGDGMRTVFPAFHAPPPEQRVIDCYVTAHYHHAAAAGSFEILERNATQ